MPDRGIGISRLPSGEEVSGDHHLLLIGINNYTNWKPLRGPVGDCEAVEQVLFDRYGYVPERTVKLLNDQATRSGILDGFRRLRDSVGPDDSVLIYYAGHGYTDEFNVGFWIPHDAGLGADEADRWLPNANVLGAVTAMDCAHVFLVSDSCFSGDLLDESRGGEIPTFSDAYFRRAYDLRSRQVMTSGASETVSDVNLQGHSAFAFHLLDTLKRNQNSCIDPIRLYDRIRSGVEEHQPLLGDLRSAGHQRGGSFLFFLNDRSDDGGESLANENLGKVSLDPSLVDAVLSERDGVVDDELMTELMYRLELTGLTPIDDVLLRGFVERRASQRVAQTWESLPGPDTAAPAVPVDESPSAGEVAAEEIATESATVTEPVVERAEDQPATQAPPSSKVLLVPMMVLAAFILIVALVSLGQERQLDDQDERARALEAVNAAVAYRRASSSSAQAVRIQASVDRARTAPKDPFLFTVVVESEKIVSASDLDLGLPNGIQVLRQSSSTSTLIQIVGGSMVQIPTITSTYTLQAEEAGTYVLGPVKMEHEGASYASKAVRVEAVKGLARPRTSSPSNAGSQSSARLLQEIEEKLSEGRKAVDRKDFSSAIAAFEAAVGLGSSDAVSLLSEARQEKKRVETERLALESERQRQTADAADPTHHRTARDSIEVQSTPTEFGLLGNFPNPFKPGTTIKYNVSEKGFVSVRIYNVVGQVVRTLVREKLPAGRYTRDRGDLKRTVVWDGTDDRGVSVSSGTYFCEIRSSVGFHDVKKLMLLK